MLNVDGIPLLKKKLRYVIILLLRKPPLVFLLKKLSQSLIKVAVTVNGGMFFIFFFLYWKKLSIFLYRSQENQSKDYFQASGIDWIEKKFLLSNLMYFWQILRQLVSLSSEKKEKEKLFGVKEKRGFFCVRTLDPLKPYISAYLTDRWSLSMLCA